MDLEFIVNAYELPEKYLDQLPCDVTEVFISYYVELPQTGNRSGHPDTWTEDLLEDFEILSVEWFDYSDDCFYNLVVEDDDLYPLCKKYTEDYLEWLIEP